MIEVVTAIGENPSVVTMCRLRHSCIVRHCCAVHRSGSSRPLRDTSVAMMEKTYSRHIAEHNSDSVARLALLQEPAPVADKVVALVR
jgi:hypothetical protein